VTRVSFDIGGVLSKYPDVFRPVVAALQASPDLEVFVLTDMHDAEESREMLERNGFRFSPDRIINSDFNAYGESCKAEALQEHKIDMHMDDFPAYLADGCPVRLMLLPDIDRPYYHDSWWTNGKYGEFGRRSRRDKSTPERKTP